MAWARDFLVMLPACPPPVSAVPLSARAGFLRGETARVSLVPVITDVLHCFVPFLFLAGQFLWFSETVYVEPSLHQLVIWLGCVSGSMV